MNDVDVKRITQAVREAVKADVREIVKEEVEGTLATITKDLKEVKNTQENQVLPSVITTETTIKGYADAYKTNIIPPPEFAIQR